MSLHLSANVTDIFPLHGVLLCLKMNKVIHVVDSWLMLCILRLYDYGMFDLSLRFVDIVVMTIFVIKINAWLWLQNAFVYFIGCFTVVAECIYLFIWCFTMVAKCVYLFHLMLAFIPLDASLWLLNVFIYSIGFFTMVAKCIYLSIGCFTMVAKCFYLLHWMLHYGC